MVAKPRGIVGVDCTWRHHTRRQDQHLAGVVLISDGRDTSDGEPPQQVLAAMGPVKEKLRVAAIGLGNPASGKDLWVDRIRAKEVVLVRDNVIFETALRHTDFEKHFIRAEVIAFDTYIELGGEAQAKTKGAMQVEGKEYEVRDGDVIFFRTSA